MTMQNKSSFQWGVIVTLTLAVMGLAAGYGAKAERLEAMVLVSQKNTENIEVLKVQHSEAIEALNDKINTMAGDLREIKTLLRNNNSSNP